MATLGWDVTTAGWPVTTPSELVWVRKLVKEFSTDEMEVLEAEGEEETARVSLCERVSWLKNWGVRRKHLRRTAQRQRRRG